MSLRQFRDIDFGGELPTHIYFDTSPNTTFFFYSKEKETEMTSEDGRSKEAHDQSGT